MSYYGSFHVLVLYLKRQSLCVLSSVILAYSPMKSLEVSSSIEIKACWISRFRVHSETLHCFHGAEDDTSPGALLVCLVTWEAAYCCWCQILPRMYCKRCLHEDEALVGLTMWRWNMVYNILHLPVCRHWAGRTLLFCITQIVCFLGFINFIQVEISIVWKWLLFYKPLKGGLYCETSVRRWFFFAWFIPEASLIKAMNQ